MSNDSRVAIELVVDDKGTALIKRFASESEASFHKIELAGTNSAGHTLIGWEKMGDKGTATVNRFATESEKNFNKVGQAGSKSSDLLLTGWEKLIGVMAAYFTVQAAADIVKTADDYTLLNSRLQLVTSSSSELAMVQEELFRISQATGTGYADNAASFSKLGMALKGVGASAEELLTINEMVNKSLTVSGASTAEAASFQLQFAQAMGSGVLQGDEFRAMMESNSYFGAQLAKALGTNISGLRQMSADGKLTTDVLRDAFPKMASEINGAFDKMPLTVGKAFTEVRNSFNALVSDMNTNTGFTEKMAKSFQTLADKINELRNTDGLGEFTKKMIDAMPDIDRGEKKLRDFYDYLVKANNEFYPKNSKKWEEFFGWLENITKKGAASTASLREINAAINNIFTLQDAKVTENYTIPAKLAAELAKGLDTLTKSHGEYKKAIDATTSSQIKLSVEQVKEAEKIVAAEKKKAEDIVNAQEEMYKVTGALAEKHYDEEVARLKEEGNRVQEFTNELLVDGEQFADKEISKLVKGTSSMSEQHYAAEEEKLTRRALSWKKANGNIIDIENWLYEQLGVLEAEADSKGDVASAAAMDRAQGNYRVLIDELEAAVNSGKNQTDQMQQQIKGLDGTSFTISANLDGSGFENTINVLIDKFRQLAATAAAVKAQAASISGSSASLPSTFGEITYPDQSNGDLLNSDTIININQQLSRSDVNSIINEQKRIEARK